MPKRNASKTPKTASKRGTHPPGTGNGGVVPPVEHRFKPGNTAAVGHGRPPKLRDLQDAMKRIGDENIENSKLTRLELMIRKMYITSNSSDHKTLLEYQYGAVKQETHTRTWEDDVIDLLVDGKITEQQVADELPEHFESLIARSRLRRNDNGAVDGEISASDSPA